jgi:hypothetical protein
MGEDRMTDLEKLRTQRVRGIRSEYEFEIADDADVADVCASYTWDRFTVMMIPTIGEGFLHFEVHQFVDGMCSGPSAAVTITP